MDWLSPYLHTGRSPSNGEPPLAYLTASAYSAGRVPPSLQPRSSEPIDITVLPIPPSPITGGGARYAEDAYGASISGTYVGR